MTNQFRGQHDRADGHHMTTSTVKPHEALEQILAILGCDREQAAVVVAALIARPAVVTPARVLQPWRVKHGRQLHRGASIATRTRTYERRAKAWEYRKLSMSLEQIAKRLGVSIRTIRDDLRWWHDALVPADVEERRALELESIDLMTHSVAVLALQGDLDAMREWRALRGMHQKVSGVLVAPPMVVLPSADQWDELIDAVCAAHPAQSGVIDVEGVNVDDAVLVDFLGELEMSAVSARTS